MWIMIGIFALLIVAMILVIRFCKRKGLKLGLAIFIIVMTCYCIVFTIDMGRVSALREPIFAIETGHMGSMVRYDGLFYTIGLEKDASTGHVSYSQMTMFGMFIVGAVE